MNHQRGANPPEEPAADDPETFREGDDELYLPFAGRKGEVDTDELPGDVEGDQLLDADPDAVGEDMAAVRMRPPPGELSRRDRREWHRLELARVNRAAQTVASRRHTAGSSSWSGGFIKNPPRGLGREGRKAWLVAEQEASKDWWTQRRASNRDISSRAAGVAVLALLIGIAGALMLIFHHADPGSSNVTAVPASIPAGTTPVDTAASSASGSVPAARMVPGVTGTVAVATANAAVGATPTLAPPVSGRWQPTPAGGVAPITPAPAGTIDPAAVRPTPPLTGRVTAADQAGAAAVVSSWLARTCPSSWREPFGADLLRGQALETTAAWKVDDPARDTVGAAIWRSEAVAHRQTRRCGNLTVTVSPDQKPTAHGSFVLYSADRVVTSADGQAATVEHLSGARRVVHTGDAWLVDVAVVGG